MPDDLVTGNQDWRGGLPEDIRGEKSLEVIKGKDWGEAGPILARSYVEAQKMIGGSIRIPDEKTAKPEDWQRFYTRLGRPETPDKYEITKPMLPQGVGWNEAIEKNFRGVAHELGLNNKQVQRLVNLHGEMTLGALQEGSSIREANVASIKKKYGADFGNRAALAEKAVYHLAQESGIPMEGVKNFLESTGLGDNPVLFEMFGKLGESYLEDGFIRADGIPGSGKEAAQAKIKAINADQKHPYWDETNPGHKDAVKEVTELFKQAHG